MYQHPQDLLELPIIPRSDEERDTLPERALEFDDDLKMSVGQNEYNNSGYEEWFRERAIDPALLSIQVNPRNFEHMENLSDYSHLGTAISTTYWDETCHPTTIQLKRILEIIREDVVKEYYINSLKEMALETILEEKPELLPKQPIHVF